MIKYFPSYILPHSEGDIETRTSSVKIQLRNCTCHTSGAVTRFNLQHKKLEKMYDYSQDLSPCPAGEKKTTTRKVLFSIELYTYFHGRRGCFALYH